MARRGISVLDLLAPVVGPGSQDLVPADIASALENLSVVQHTSTTSIGAHIHCGTLQSAQELVLILWDALPKALQALPAALASVAAGVLGTFRFRDNQGRWAISQETLEHELFHFKNRIGPSYPPEMDAETALARFVKAVEDGVISETADWRRLATVQPASPEKQT